MYSMAEKMQTAVCIINQYITILEIWKDSYRKIPSYVIYQREVFRNEKLCKKKFSTKNHVDEYIIERNRMQKSDLSTNMCLKSVDIVDECRKSGNV